MCDESLLAYLVSFSGIDNSQDPGYAIEMTAEHVPADQTEGLAAVGESILFGVQSTNTGNVDVERVTMLDTAGRLSSK